MTQEQIAGMLIILIALVILIFPKQVWKIAESWKNKEKTSTRPWQMQIFKTEKSTICRECGFLK